MKASPIEKINPDRLGFRHYNAPEAEHIGKNSEENRFHAPKISTK
jgi:hypothetical protein